MSAKLLVHPSSTPLSTKGTGVHPGNGSATGMELISGPKKSWTPLPLGPLVHSYAGCLSVHAVRPPCARTTSNRVFTRRYWCGKTGAQPFVGSRGRNAGLMPPPPFSMVKSVSTPSSSSTTAPIVPGQDPPELPTPGFPVNCGESARLYVMSYQKPVVVGEPPVTRAASPG